MVEDLILPKRTYFCWKEHKNENLLQLQFVTPIVIKQNVQVQIVCVWYVVCNRCQALDGQVWQVVGLGFNVLKRIDLKSHWGTWIWKCKEWNIYFFLVTILHLE